MIVGGVKKYQEVVGKAKVLYYIFGERPKILLDSGTHGDEFEVIGSVEKAIKKYISLMPSFIYIPEISPSAVRLRTRVNENDKDLNRSFLDKGQEDEAKAVMKIIGKYHFDLNVSFHEDEDKSEFYFYDSEAMDKSVLKKIREEVEKLGVGLFNGIDDENDPILRKKIKDGHFVCSKEENEEENGFLWTWLYRNKKIKRIILPEIPGKVSQEKKDEIVDVFFREVILKLGK